MKYLFLLFCAFTIGCNNEKPPDNNTNDPSVVEIKENRKPVIGLVNAYRLQNGLNALQEAQTLNTVTNDYANLMASRNALSHQLNGTPESRLKKYEYTWAWFGENIAYGQNNPEDVMASWENSPPHKKNMLDPRATELGYTCCEGKNGRYHCLILAKPK